MIRIQLSTVLQCVVSQLLIPRIDKPGRYTLRATAWPLNYKASPPFDITAAAPAPGLRTGVKPARPGATP